MSKNRLSIFSLLISVSLGISSTAIMQRINGFFFLNVFIGAFLGAITILLLFHFIMKKWKSSKEVLPYMVAISFLMTFSFLSTIPLTIDRSYSVWLLKNVADAESSNKDLTYMALIENSETFFSQSNGQLTRRISEQERIGNIKVTSSGTIELSPKGRYVVRLNQLIGIVFGLDPKYSKLSP